MLPVAVTRSSFDGVAMRHVLPVLWMTSCFHTMGPMARIKHDTVKKKFARWQYQLDIRHYSVWLNSSECSTAGDEI